MAVGAAGLSLAATGSAQWQAACVDPVTEARVEAVIPPLPQPGEWRGKGFGDKRKVDDVRLEECGDKLLGLVGVRLKYNVPQMVTLDRDDEGVYSAEFVWTEQGAAVVVTWDLRAVSPERIEGRMSIMGRTRDVHADLLEPKPYPDMTECECVAVERRRDEVAEALATARDGAATRVARDWRLDGDTCAIEAHDPDLGFPTQSSYEVAARARFDGLLVHRDRCCSVQESAPPAYPQWAATESSRDDRIAALTREIAALDDWLDDRCPDDDGEPGRQP